MKSVRKKLGIGLRKLYELKDKPGDIIRNFDDIVKSLEEFYMDRTESGHSTFIRSSDKQDRVVPSIISDEVRRSLQDIARGKAAGEDGIRVDLLEAGGNIVLEKLAALYSQCLTNSSVPENWKMPKLY